MILLYRFKIAKLSLFLLSILTILLSYFYKLITPLKNLFSILLADPIIRTLLFIEWLFIMISLSVIVLMLITFPKIGNTVRDADARIIGRGLIDPLASIFGLMNTVAIILSLILSSQIEYNIYTVLGFMFLIAFSTAFFGETGKKIAEIVSYIAREKFGEIIGGTIAFLAVLSLMTSTLYLILNPLIYLSPLLLLIYCFALREIRKREWIRTILDLITLNNKFTLEDVKEILSRNPHPYELFWLYTISSEIGLITVGELETSDGSIIRLEDVVLYEKYTPINFEIKIPRAKDLFLKIRFVEGICIMGIKEAAKELGVSPKIFPLLERTIYNVFLIDDLFVYLSDEKINQLLERKIDLNLPDYVKAELLSKIKVKMFKFKK